MEAITLCLWLLSFLLLLIVYWYLSVPKNLPPGSSGIPLLGYFPFLEQATHLAFTKLGKKYGNIFHLYIFNQLIVVLNDHEAIKEAYVKQGDIFAGRMKNEHDDFKTSAIFSGDGEYWKQHRRFFVRNLKDHGVGKSILEPLIMNELEHCLTEIRNSEGKKIEIKKLLNASLANNINILVTGNRYDYDHPAIVTLFDVLDTIGDIPQIQTYRIFPHLMKLPILRTIFRIEFFKQMQNHFLAALRDLIDKIKIEYKEGNVDNYIHAYMTERNCRKTSQAKENIFTDEGMCYNTRDLLIAGTETSAATLHWALLYMTLYPQIQHKVQEEIDRVIGSEREPSFNDMKSMPYVEATISELYRITSLSPTTLAHRTLKDTTLMGHFIPKDTLIYANLWLCHHDNRIWTDPEIFQPERFLSPEGHYVKSEFLIPFSAGKRQCAGEPLARMEVFLYFVALLQNFDFIPYNGEAPTLDAVSYAVRRPKYPYICAISRK